jgi:hypothetical protein
MAYIPVAVFVVGLIVWNIVDRTVYSTKRHGWVEVKATVRSVVSKAVGEFPTPFVDVSYEFRGVEYLKKSLNTEGNQTSEYPPGKEIAVLVNPNSPMECRILRRPT